MSRNRSRGRHLFLSCGEASGDRYGAALVAALRELDPDLRFSALGGDGLAMAGAQIVQPSAEIEVMGFAEVVQSLPAIWRARRRVWRRLAERDFDLVVPIDFPGFNTQLARRAKALGMPVFYLVAPQFWAWGEWRLGGFRKVVDRFGTILPFETEYFARHGVSTFAMGHPLMEDYGRSDLGQLCAEREIRLQGDAAPLTIAFIPGSRRQEVDRLVPIMKVTAGMVRAGIDPRPVRFLLSAAPGIDQPWLQSLAGAGLEIRDEPLPLLLERSDLAVVCSGTASLETALAGVPHEIVYRTGRFNYAIGRRLVKTDFIGLSNLVLDRRLVREHLQDEVTPISLATALLHWAGSPTERLRFYEGVTGLRRLLGEPGVWQRTAEAIVTFMDGG